MRLECLTLCIFGSLMWNASTLAVSRYADPVGSISGYAALVT